MATLQIWAFRGVPTTLDLRGYDVEAVDGSIGTIDEATAHARENYVVVDTGPWIFGKRVLLPAGIVDRVDSAERKVYVNRSREEIRNAPEYDPDSGATEPFRRRIGSYYAARGIGESARQGRSETRRASTSTRSRATRGKASSSSRARSRSQQGARRRASEEPTKDDLYQEAKRLGIEGRSKMNKTQLKRAVSRRRSASPQSGRRKTPTGRGKANPVDVQAFLDGVSYPTRKGDLIREAERRRASRDVRSTLERLPEQRFKDPTEVSEAIGKLR